MYHFIEQFFTKLFSLGEGQWLPFLVLGCFVSLVVLILRR